jgi:tetratricopeptide (TPR) repeat protein
MKTTTYPTGAPPSRRHKLGSRTHAGRIPALQYHRRIIAAFWVSAALFLIFIVAGVMLATPGLPQRASHSRESAKTYFAQAQASLAQNDLSTALASVEHGLAITPHSVEGLNLLGITLARQGHLDEALQAFKEALRINPRSTATHNNLGDFYVNTGKLNLAEKEFQATLRLNPNDHTANYNLGAILLSRHDASGALPYLLRVQPVDTATQFNLVQAYLETRQTEKALSLARSLSSQSPNNLRLHFSLGVLLASARQYPAAIHELELADALRPGTFEILYNLGEAYLRNANYAKADTTLQRALDLQPDSVSALYLQAQTFEHEKKTLQAFQLLFRARKLAPRNTDVIFLLARLSMQQSYYEDAIPLLEEGIKLAPRRPDLHAALGESYFSAGKIQQAYHEFQTLLRLDPSAQSDIFMGLYYRHQGQFDPAKKYFAAGLQKDPHNADCLYNLGLIADKQGNYLEAERYLDHALQSNPRHEGALFELATVKVEEKKFAEAIPLLRRAIDLDPNQSKAYYKLAVAERSLGQRRAAAEDFKIFETLAKNPSPGPMPFGNFLESVSQKVSLPPEEQAQLDLRELQQEIKAHPDRPRNLYLLAQTYLKLGQTPQALRALTQLRQLSGGDLRTLIGAGVLLARYKLYPDAIQFFQSALAVDPNSDDAKYDLANAYFETQDYGHALEWLQRISPQGQNDPATMALLADTQAHLGRLEQAESIFQKVLQKSPDDDRYYLSLALVQIRAGDLAGAQKTLAQGQARIPDSGRILWGLGVLSVVQGDNSQAEADLERALDLMPEWENSYSALGTFYFETGQISKAQETLDRYAHLFPHGDLNVNGLRRLLANAANEKPPQLASLPAQARSQFLGMALALADRNP